MSAYFVKLLGARPMRLRVDEGEMLVIGRGDDADLQLEDKLVSRRHCEIEVRQGTLIVRDLGSRNGTGLNGRRFAGERVAHPGDQVKVGSHFLLIERNLDSGVHDSREQSSAPRRSPSARFPSIPGYEIIKMLGRGRTGRVYRARSLLDQREVAIKVLEATADETTVARFQRSAQALMRLDHPNIVTVENVDSIGDLHFFVMEHLRGQELDQLAHKGGLGVREALSILVQVARALKTVHEHDIIHRDVSPENIIVLREGTVRLIGFGYAKESVSESPSLTALDEIVGTIAYSSPEQVTDPREVDSRADIYSLGAVLFYALTGRPPYEGRNHLELIRKVMLGDAPRIRSIDGSLPLPLDDLVAAMLDRDPGRRPSTASEVEARLEDALLIVCGAEHERTTDEKSFGGGFSGAELLEIAQFLELHKKSGRLVVSAGSLEGEVGLRNGLITSALAGQLEGETAASTLLSATEGTFRFRATVEGERPADMGIKLSPSVLALDVLRRRDEASRR